MMGELKLYGIKAAYDEERPEIPLLNDLKPLNGQEAPVSS